MNQTNLKHTSPCVKQTEKVLLLFSIGCAGVIIKHNSFPRALAEILNSLFQKINNQRSTEENQELGKRSKKDMNGFVNNLHRTEI
jgi:hypothetical protein